MSGKLLPAEEQHGDHDRQHEQVAGTEQLHDEDSSPRRPIAERFAASAPSVRQHAPRRQVDVRVERGQRRGQVGDDPGAQAGAVARCARCRAPRRRRARGPPGRRGCRAAARRSRPPDGAAGPRSGPGACRCPRRCAPTRTARPGRGAAAAAGVSASAASTLLNTSCSGTPSASMSPSTSRTARICASGSASAASTTCRIRSASADLLQRRAERLDQLGRQVPDEADGVGQGERPARPRPGRGARSDRGSRTARSRRARRRRSAGSAATTCRRWCSRRARPRARCGVRRRARLTSRAVFIPASSLRSLRHPRGDPPPVDLDLGLTRAAAADADTAGRSAADLAGERLAPAAQPRAQVLQLGEFDLGLALLGAGVLGEDVEDQRGAVDDLDLDDLLQLLQLAGGQLAVADHRVGALGLRRCRAAPWPCPSRCRWRRRACRGAGSARRAPASPPSRPGGPARPASSRRRRACRPSRRRRARPVPGAAGGTRPR